MYVKDSWHLTVAMWRFLQDDRKLSSYFNADLSFPVRRGLAVIREDLIIPK